MDDIPGTAPPIIAHSNASCGVILISGATIATKFVAKTVVVSPLSVLGVRGIGDFNVRTAIAVNIMCMTTLVSLTHSVRTKIAFMAWEWSHQTVSTVDY